MLLELNKDKLKRKNNEELSNLFLECLLENERCSLYLKEERPKFKISGEEILLSLLDLNKNKFELYLSKIKWNKFLGYLRRNSLPDYNFFQEERDTFMEIFQGKSIYNIFLGYGILIKNKEKNFKKFIREAEFVIDLAKRNRDLVYLGRLKKGIIISSSLGRETILFKKEKKEKGVFNLENKVWRYYTFVNHQLKKKRAKEIGGYTYEINDILNLPRRILCEESINEEGVVYLIWKYDSNALLKCLISSAKQKNEIINHYIKQIAIFDACGPLHLVPKENYLITQQDFLRRMNILFHKKIKSEKIKKQILNSYSIIAKYLGRTKNKGVTKDATLENATYKDGKITILDFNKLRLSPLVMDLGKILVLSYQDRKEYLLAFIEEYNKTIDLFNSTVAQKKIFSQYEPEMKKKKIISNFEEFYFTYLNSVVDYSLFFLVENEYSQEWEGYDIKNIQKNNAFQAIEELIVSFPKKIDNSERKKLEKLRNFLQII